VSSIGVVPVNAQTSTSIWASTCDLTEANANTYLSAYRYACGNVGNGGATFSGGVTTDKLNLDGTWTYCAKYSCNACTSLDIQTKKRALTDSCTAECLTTNFMCSATGAFTYNLNFADCSETPLTTGTCAESSSSSTGSSSSVISSSSSVEGTSSASEPGSSTTVNSSTSTGTLTCYDYVNGQCVNIGESDEFLSIPKFLDSPSVISSYCSNSFFHIETNIPSVYQLPKFCKISSNCTSGSAVDVYYYYNCNSVETPLGCLSASVGFHFDCDSTTCYYDASSVYYLPSNVSTSDIYSLVNQAAVSAGYSNYAAAADYCKSIYSSSSVEGGSSATPISSSSIDGSSSSEEPYESSSSGGEETSSSSSGNDESSSSSASGIDSSCPDCETNVRSAEAVYTSDQIFNSGLENMEDGKCYSLNPDRGTQYGWINNNAQDSWWWVEVPCDGSAPEEESTSAGCVENQRGANAVYTSADCFSSGLDNMEEGECYSLNPDRGTQYGWINNNAQDSWWWVETPCEAEEYANTCPDGSTLYKKTTAQAIEASSENNSTYTLEMPKVFYDALGRKTTDSPKTKRHLFESKREYKTPTDINSWSEETSIYLESISVECGNNSKGEWVCEEVSGESVLKKSGADSSGIDTCGILGGDYGILESNGSLRGGRTCVHTAFKVLISKHPNSEIGLCKDGSKLLKVSVTLKTTPSTLSRNDPFSVPAGYVFPNGYTATKEDETAMHYHELGHVKYNTCIKFPEIKKSYSLDCVCESELEKTYNETIDTLKKIGNERDKKLVDDTGDLFHQKYGTGGYAKTYMCPED